MRSTYLRTTVDLCQGDVAGGAVLGGLGRSPPRPTVSVLALNAGTCLQPQRMLISVATHSTIRPSRRTLRQFARSAANPRALTATGGFAGRPDWSGGYSRGVPTMSEWRAATTFWPPDETPPGLESLLSHFRRASAGFYVGPGWFELVGQCHARLVAAFPDYELLAVKQKDGCLAFQAFPRPWVQGQRTWTMEEAFAVDRIIAPFETESERICERCGVLGYLRETRPILVVLCDRFEVEVLRA
jgi:hypothetical protein